ncbi:hypothetical protein [Shewanella aestuarii]|uniref:Uncharacterized protein n=1 Tax=Shewanella aestuarii TaxID=1028752 RepID=A0A6G9QPZ4_9GAMM|nr:hypothetical protein [Shewanella aestuarii]QIR16664.1 hypothetical protein HBH39_19515 [Shewanella aestuarii]
MSIKKSVRLSDEAERLCYLLSPYGEPNYSGSLNALAHRYNLLIENVMPELSEQEALVFASLYNGHMLNDNIKLEAQSIEWQLAEGFKYDATIGELIENADTTLEKLHSKVASWSIAERIAVIDMTQRFWSKGRADAMLGKEG